MHTPSTTPKIYHYRDQKDPTPFFARIHLAHYNASSLIEKMQGPIEDVTIYLMVIAALAFIVGVSSLVYSICHNTTNDRSANKRHEQTTNDLKAIKQNTCILGTAFLKFIRGENGNFDDLERGLQGLE